LVAAEEIVRNSIEKLSKNNLLALVLAFLSEIRAKGGLCGGRSLETERFIDLFVRKRDKRSTCEVQAIYKQSILLTFLFKIRAKGGLCGRRILDMRRFIDLFDKKQDKRSTCGVQAVCKQSVSLTFFSKTGQKVNNEVWNEVFC